MSEIMSSIIGHRGVASLAPENTLAGIKKAMELGIEWVEMDVTLLSDGTPVMFHDSFLRRTTGGRGYINSINFESACHLDAGSWFSAKYAGERIPTLANILTAVKRTAMGINLELKPNRCDKSLLVTNVDKLIRISGVSKKKILISSYSLETLKLFSALSIYNIGCLFERLSIGWKQQAEQVCAVTIHLNGNILSEKNARLVKGAGYGLYCYTVNNPLKAKQLNLWEVDGIFSDRPHLLTLNQR